jgi:hypothetical protein
MRSARPARYDGSSGNYSHLRSSNDPAGYEAVRPKHQSIFPVDVDRREALDAAFPLRKAALSESAKGHSNRKNALKPIFCEQEFCD